MGRNHFDAFLSQAIDEDRDTEGGLDPDELYGLYTSWCLLNHEEPQAPEALWEALRAHRIEPGDNHVGMKGSAAADYILSSEPDLA